MTSDKPLPQIWFLPLLPGVLTLVSVYAYAEYQRWGMTPEQRLQYCDACPEDPYALLGLVLLLVGIIPSIVLFIGGGADRKAHRRAHVED